MLTKEQYIAKEIELTAAYEAADKAFDKMMPSDYNKKPAKLFGIVKDE